MARYKRGSRANTPPQWWDLDDGWTIYDSNSRLAAAPTKIGRGAYRFPVSAGWTGDDLTGASGIIVIFRPVKDYRGRIPDPSRPWCARIGFFDRTRRRRTTDDNTFIVCGYLNGLPSVAGTTILKAIGLTHGATTPVGTMTGTAGAASFSTATDQVGARGVSLTLARSTRQQLCTLSPGALTDGLRNNLSTVVFVNATVATAGVGTTIYEFIAIGRVGAGVGTREIDLRVTSGTLPDDALPAYYGASMAGETVDACLVGDSTWFGATAGSPGSIPYTCVGLEYLLTRDYGRSIPAIRLVGGTALSAANGANILSGNQTWSPSSGKSLANLITDQPATVAALAALAVPAVARVVVINAGYQDAEAGDTAAQMRTKVETLAALWLASGADEVHVTAQPPKITGALGKAAHDAFCAALLAAAPVGISKVIDCFTWWTPAFRDGAGDGHPNQPANPDFADTWETLDMDPNGADFSQNGCAVVAFATAEALTGIRPPLKVGEVAPY